MQITLREILRAGAFIFPLVVLNDIVSTFEKLHSEKYEGGKLMTDFVLFVASFSSFFLYLFRSGE